MTTFKLTLDCDNAAFEGPNFRCEVPRLLNQVAGMVRDGYTKRKLRDLNGNTVGEFVTDEA